MHKIEIFNQNKEKIVVELDLLPDNEKLFFLMHGIWANKEQPLMQTMKNALLQAGYSVVSFDARNTNGESQGSYADATTTSFYEDLQSVIERSAQQEWFSPRFGLAGHSMWALCCAWFAQHSPFHIDQLILVSSVVNREQSKFRYSDEILKKREEDWILYLNPHDPQPLKRNFIQDRKKYDLLEHCDQLNMPTLLLVWEDDNRTPLSSQKVLFDALPSTKKALISIPQARHNIKMPEHLDQIYSQIIQRVERD